VSPEAKAADHVYRQLKNDVIAGEYPPSTILNVHQIAAEIGVSISPVRDAIERLVGERLLASRAGGGFQVPIIDELALQDLYLWHGHLARWAVVTGKAIKLPDAVRIAGAQSDWDDDEAIVDATGAVFLAIGTASGSAEHVRALQSASDRLHALRVHEGSVIKDRERELSRLIQLTEPNRESQLRDAVSVYHRRRIRAVPAILKILSSQRKA
jgi:DNA-binding GntR family transcriptional regulator